MTAVTDGFVVWITGLSGVGKTTIGKDVYAALKQHRPASVFLDGDIFREIIGDELGHDPDDRLKNAYRLARMCRYLASADIGVVCCTMSLYAEIWDWNREHIPGYIEIYLRAAIDTLVQRDPKGLYARARAGEERNVVGVDLPFNEPPNADLIVDNDASGESVIAEQVERILQFLTDRDLL